MFIFYELWGLTVKKTTVQFIACIILWFGVHKMTVRTDSTLPSFSALTHLTISQSSAT